MGKYKKPATVPGMHVMPADRTEDHAEKLVFIPVRPGGAVSEADPIRSIIRKHIARQWLRNMHIPDQAVSHAQPAPADVRKRLARLRLDRPTQAIKGQATGTQSVVRLFPPEKSSHS